MPRQSKRALQCAKASLKAVNKRRQTTEYSLSARQWGSIALVEETLEGSQKARGCFKGEVYGRRVFESSVEPFQRKILRATLNSMHVKSWIGAKGERNEDSLSSHLSLPPYEPL